MSENRHYSIKLLGKRGKESTLLIRGDKIRKESNEVNQWDILSEIGTNELTTSSIPGTTLDFVKIMNLPDSLKLYDTPGIPIKNQVSSFMDNPKNLFSTICRSKIAPYNIDFKVGHSIWLGGIAKLDFLNGEDKQISICVPNQITIHRSNTNLASVTYEHQIGKLLLPIYNAQYKFDMFEKHEIIESCHSNERASFDIAINGLGWIGIQGTGQFHCCLSLHKDVGFTIRPPLTPFEVQNKGLKKLNGVTANIKKSQSLMG